MKIKKELTQKRLKEVVAYNPVDGRFLWRIKTKVKSYYRVITEETIITKVTTVVVDTKQRNSKTYTSINIDGKSYLAHRLAWLYMYGKWPEGFLDHVNNDRLDNRIDNLREATALENACNKIKYPCIWFNGATKAFDIKLTYDTEVFEFKGFVSYEDALVAYRIVTKILYREFHPEINDVYDGM